MSTTVISSFHCCNHGDKRHSGLLQFDHADVCILSKSLSILFVSILSFVTQPFQLTFGNPLFRPFTTFIHSSMAAILPLVDSPPLLPLLNTPPLLPLLDAPPLLDTSPLLPLLDVPPLLPLRQHPVTTPTGPPPLTSPSTLRRSRRRSRHRNHDRSRRRNHDRSRSH